ncbi:MAG: M48 family metallopeptidase [Actinomycetales bacterium]|jgi:heat shock protein HtpX
MANFRALQAANKRKTFGLLFFMGLLVWLIAYVAISSFGGTGAGVIPLAVGISLISVWGSYYASDKLVLKMTRAKVIQESDNPKLFNLVHEVCIASGLPMPKIAIVDDPAPNAFATGRDPNHALIAFTTGLLDVMDRDELQGVVAHEMSHVANRDTLVSAIAATTAGIVALISDILMRVLWFGGGRNRDHHGNQMPIFLAIIPLILAPIAATLLKAAISRKREALADATAVSFTRNPAGLRAALEVLARDNTVVQARSSAVAHMYIESPLDASAASKLFATHPPIQERIETLRRMEANPNL